MTEVEIKPAATIQVIREVPNDGGIEVLLLRRNRKLKFASGFWVYPGGKIDSNELSPSTPEIESARIAAVREAQEEAMLQLDPAKLSFFVHWTTPVNEKRRFGTYFFHAHLDDHNAEVRVDNSEIVEHRWLSPDAAFEALQKQEISLLPPTYISLQRIRHCQTYQDVVDEWQRAKPAYVNPIIAVEGYSVHCMYEGDAGYESGNLSVEGPRHRLVVNYKEAAFEFQHCDCDVFPVNGGRHLSSQE